MSEDNFLKKIIRRLNVGKRTSQPQSAAHQDAAMMGKLFQMVENTDEVELSCDEVFDLMDQYVESDVRGEDAASLLPLVQKHLERCRDC
ncbi:MAG: hypothetical protein KAT29_03020, partial [Anaerolineales bacterium]|nr:hypothetical protein [Anaerolineales bacterium]